MSNCILIVNADDLGFSQTVNRGILEAHERGLVTSASLMVRLPAAETAVAAAQGTDLGIGLHLDLGEWEYRDGDWHARYLVIDEQTPETVAAELARQLDQFERLAGRGPTHIDSHQHVHNDDPVRTAVLRAAERLDVPVRAAHPAIRYEGAFYGQDGRGYPVPEAIEPAALAAVIAALPDGVTELACHPSAAVEQDTTYSSERVKELATLCHAKVRAAVELRGAELRSFADFGFRPSGA